MYTYYGIGLIQFHCALRLYVFLQSGIVWTLSIWYATLHFRDQRGAASLRYRSRAKITVLMCKQKPVQAWFSCRRKSYPVSCEHLCDVWLSTLESFAPLQKSRKITVLMCKQKPVQAWFSCRRKSYPVSCEHLCDVWLSTLEIFAPLQKSRQNHRSYVWTEALFGMVFVSAKKLSAILWT